MSKALEIASERYAKGEITKDEFEEISSSLTPSMDNNSPNEVHKAHAPPNPSQASPSQGASQANAYAAFVYQKTYFDISGVAKILGWLISVSAFISVGSAVLILKQSGIQKKYDMAYALDNEPMFLVIAVVPSFIAMIMFLFWKKKSTDNLFIFRGPQSITPAGAVYWYFVPVMWFWKPYEAMRNLVFGFNVKQSDRAILPIWWGLFWGSTALAMIVGVSTPEVISTEQQIEIYANWSIVIYILEAISLVVTRKIVSTVSDAENREINGAHEKS